MCTCLLGRSTWRMPLHMHVTYAFAYACGELALPVLLLLATLCLCRRLLCVVCYSEAGRLCMCCESTVRACVLTLCVFVICLCTLYVAGMSLWAGVFTDVCMSACCLCCCLAGRDDCRVYLCAMDGTRVVVPHPVTFFKKNLLIVYCVCVGCTAFVVFVGTMCIRCLLPVSLSLKCLSVFPLPALPPLRVPQPPSFPSPP